MKIEAEQTDQLGDHRLAGHHCNDDPADLAEYNRIYREYFKTPFPARTTLLRCLGGVLKFEIDAMAIAPK